MIINTTSVLMTLPDQRDDISYPQ